MLVLVLLGCWASWVVEVCLGCWSDGVLQLGIQRNELRLLGFGDVSVEQKNKREQYFVLASYVAKGKRREKAWLDACR
jgi:hypothetical protein